ncbi:hypothetical protein V8B55DRAFT_1556994 [Mucor lusitanicus]
MNALSIKNSALELRGKFVKSKDALSPSEREVMRNRLSSILDLVDISSPGQKSLFKPDDWKSIDQYFNQKLQIEDCPVNKKTLDNWKTIACAVKRPAM